MISFLFKFTLAFTVSFFILSFKVDHKPLFLHISEFTGPIGTEVQHSFGKSMKRSLKKTREIGKGFFKNADPKVFNDHINSQQSSLNSKRDKELILEDIRQDEARKLDELINKNN